jgi:small subunit ribosomal protein S7e
VVAQRKIVPKYSRRAGAGAKPRARKYTLTAVHDAILEDLVYPTEVVGRRLRVKLDGQVLKVVLDKKEKDTVEHKLDTFATVYKKLTGKNVTFEFPTASE